MDPCQCNVGTGRFELTIEAGSRHQSYNDPPWKIFGPVTRHGMEILPVCPPGLPSYYLSNITAGILAGDQLEGRVCLHKNAGANLIAPAATRIFSMPRGSHAEQNLIFSLASEASLFYYANQIIPYRDADFSQTCEYHLEDTSSLVLMEFFAPGRIASGEWFAFRSLLLRNRIIYDRTLILDDRIKIEPKSPLEFANPNTGIISRERPVIGTVYLAGRATGKIRPDKFQAIPFTGFTQPHPQLIIGRSIQPSVQEAEMALRMALGLMAVKNEG
jgi:urease accessory protein